MYIIREARARVSILSQGESENKIVPGADLEISV